MARRKWMAVVLLIVLVASALGVLTGYLWSYLMVGPRTLTSGTALPYEAAMQIPGESPMALATSTSTPALSEATREPPTPTSTSVASVSTYTPLPGPTLVPPETVEADDWEPDGSRAGASPLGVGDIQSHNLHLRGDHDWVYMEAEEGSTYVVETANLGGGIDTAIYLYDREGNKLLSDDDGGGELWASRFQWTATEEGRLYVMIRDLGDNDAGPRTSYDVSLSLGEAFEIDEYEPDDSRAGANSIAVGETQTHNLHVEGDRDWVYFEALAGTTYAISTSNLGSDVDTIIFLYDGQSHELASDDDRGGEFLASRLEWTVDSDGALYVMTRDLWGTSAGPGTEYDVSVSRM